MEESDKIQFAVLIDADNISSKYTTTIFDELEKYGVSTYRRIYGNWSKSNGWNEETLLVYSIMPVQQFSYTSGKNATDMAMAIDAMDILYKDKVQGFCLVTSDSDFTRLAMRLREENKFVIGMGESKTPIALARACNKFIHLNLIAEQNKDTAETETMTEEEEQSVTSLAEVKQLVLSILNNYGDRPVELGVIGNHLNEKFSDFDVRNYGYSKLSVMIAEEMPDIVIEKVNTQNVVYKHSTVTKEDLEQEIVRLIQKDGGMIENLSTLNEELRKKYTHFDLKEFGYSRLSSLLRSMKSLNVQQNSVTLREQKNIEDKNPTEKKKITNKNGEKKPVRKRTPAKRNTAKKEKE